MVVENPTKMTDEIVKKLEEAFLLDCTIEEACFVANISPRCYHNWMESFPDLKERFSQCRQNMAYLARKRLQEDIQKDGKIALDYMKCKKKGEFSTKVENEMSGGVEIKVSKDISDKYETNTSTGSNSEG